jgi:hypothetical protein
LAVIFLSLFSRKSQDSGAGKVNSETRKSWFQRLKKQIKITLMKLTSKDYRKGFLDLLAKGFSPVSYPSNLTIPIGFRYSTEAHLFSG